MSDKETFPLPPEELGDVLGEDGAAYMLALHRTIFGLSPGEAGTLDETNVPGLADGVIKSGPPGPAGPPGQTGSPGNPGPQGATGAVGNVFISTTTTVPLVGGTQFVASAFLPAASLVVGVFVVVLTGINGASSWRCGSEFDDDAYGASIAPTVGATTSIADLTVGAPWFQRTAADVFLQANDGSFVSGVVQLTCWYWQP